MKHRIALIVLAVMFAACPKAREEEHEEHGHGHDEHGEEGEHGEAADRTLVIDTEMLRDLRVTTSEAEARAGGEGVMVLGEITVNEDAYAEVGSPVVARIVAVHASAGDRVTAEQPLVELESNDLGSARAAMLSARARVELANQALERKRALVAERIAPARELDEAQAEARSAEAELQAARASLSALGSASGSGGRLVLRAPLTGTVLERNAVRGRIASVEDSLFRVADLSRLWLTVQAFERDAVRVHVGTQARASLPALPGQVFTGSISYVGTVVDTHSRTIPVRVELTNENSVLRPGMSANAWLPLGEDGATIVAVPAAALQRMREGWAVFVPRSTRAFEIRQVGRGRDLGGEVEVVSGLRAGERVVVEGAFLLKAEADKARGEGEHHEH